MPNRADHWELNQPDPLYQEFELPVWKKSVERQEIKRCKTYRKKKAESKVSKAVVATCNKKPKAHTDYGVLWLIAAELVKEH